jgi:hypothetical protein
MLYVDLLEDCDAVVCDDDVAKAVDETASATAFAAAMLLNCAPFPRSLFVPSFKINIGVPP